MLPVLEFGVFGDEEVVVFVVPPVDDGKYCEGRHRCSQICGSRLGRCGCANGSAGWILKMSGERNG